MRGFLRQSALLGRRATVQFLMEPAATLPNLFIPIFFFVVNAAALGGLIPGLEGNEYHSFVLPVSVLQAVAGVAVGSGLALVNDIDRGYFDKLLLAPITRPSILVGRLGSDFVRTFLQGLLVVVVGLFVGIKVATGPLGIVVLLVLCAAWGVAYAGLGLMIALRTKSVQATQASFVLFFPLIFLSETFVPKDRFSAQWLKTVVTYNPITYMLRGARSLLLEGWDPAALGRAFLVVALVGLVLLLPAFRSLRKAVDA